MHYETTILCIKKLVYLPFYSNAKTFSKGEKTHNETNLDTTMIKMLKGFNIYFFYIFFLGKTSKLWSREAQ